MQHQNSRVQHHVEVTQKVIGAVKFRWVAIWMKAKSTSPARNALPSHTLAPDSPMTASGLADGHAWGQYQPKTILAQKK